MANTTYVGAIEGFKSQIRSIQRASLFDVTVTNFKYSTADTARGSAASQVASGASAVSGSKTSNSMANMLKFSVKSATFPATTVGQIQVNYMGRVINWYGDRQYGGTWDTTCILDGRWEIFNAIYAWNQGMGGANRVVSEDLNTHDHFKCDAYVTAYSTDGQPAHTIMLKGLWPQNLGDISMDWGTPDTAVDFVVTWVYDYIVTDPVTPPAETAGSTTDIGILEGTKKASS